MGLTQENIGTLHSLPVFHQRNGCRLWAKHFATPLQSIIPAKHHCDLLPTLCSKQCKENIISEKGHSSKAVTEAMPGNHLPGCLHDPFFPKPPPYTGQASEGPSPTWSSKQAAAGAGLEPILIQHVCVALYRRHQSQGDAASIIFKLYCFALKHCSSLKKYLCLFQTKFVRWICNIVTIFIFPLCVCVLSL